MRALRVWATRLLRVVGLGRRPADLDAELESHVALHTDDNLRSGMSPEEARRAALLALGSAQATREVLHAQNAAPFAGHVSTALRQAYRSLARRPGFSAVVVLTLGMGVGMTAALGGVADALLFRPPDHVASPDRLVRVTTAGNYPQYELLAAHTRTLNVTAVTRRRLSLGQGVEATPLETQCVTDAYFQVLGATPVAGRTFAPGEGTPGSARVVMLAHHIWLREFGGREEIVGRSVHIGGAPHVVIGVAPPGFRGLELTAVDAWVLLPLSPAECSLSGISNLGSTSGSWLTTLGRLRPGIAATDAAAEVQSLALEALRAVTSTPSTFIVSAIDARAAAGARDQALSIWLATGASLLLLIAASNVAGLLSVRALDRRREVTLRLQLGATRARVFLQLLMENVLLTVAAALAAWLVAGWVGTGVSAYLPSVTYHPWFDARMAAVLSAFLLVGGIVSGLIPALQTARHSSSLPQQHSSPTSRRRAVIRDGLLAGQVALTLVLSVAAGLFVHSVVRVKSNVGYDLDRVLVATLDLNRAGIRRHVDKRQTFDRILARLRETPGIQSVALSSTSPLGTGQFSSVTPGGPPGSATSRPSMTLVHVTPAYFSTIGTRVVEGRSFTDADITERRPVAMMGAELAALLWPGERVVGRCMDISPGRPCVDLVGLTESRRIGSLRQTSTEVFYPMGPDSTVVPQAIMIRPTGDLRGALPAVANAIRTAVPHLPYVSVRSLEDLANTQARSWRLGAWLFGVFGAVALVLSAIGLYASLSFAVRQRTTEIGVRIALGADTSRITTLVLGQGLRAIVVGWALGVAVVVSMAGLINHLLFAVTGTDAAALVGSSVAVGLAGLCGCLWPAIRASRVDPVTALRAD
jgi:predicted permease